MQPWVVVAVVLGLVFVFLILIALASLIAARLARQATAPNRQAISTLTCPQCHQPLPPGAQQCSWCGWKYTPSSQVDSSQPVEAEAQATPTPYLSTEFGALARQQFPVQAAPRGLRLGRSTDNDVVINSMMVSRHHAQVMPEDDQYILFDRDSANGTYVNNQRVYRHVLSHSDRIQIGECVLTFVIPGEPEAPQASPLPEDDRLKLDYTLGSLFEGYELLQVLGRGGMSVVYQARDSAGKRVAIKILDVTDPWVARKFAQEGKIGAALQDNPHIRTVYDFRYSQDNHPYLVMDYIEGISLRKRLGMPMAAGEAIGIMGQVCDALDFAHQHNIVHRDIKPENILLAVDGVIKVTDFGIAKLTSSVTVTRDRIVGTPEYISPEQARGDERITPASDIYSLGIVLYEMLTGRVPFPLPRGIDPYEAAYTVIRQHLNEPPVAPSRLGLSVSSRLERAVMRALEKDPARRYARAADLAQALGYDSSVMLQRVVRSAQSARLTIVSGPGRGRTIALDGPEIELGRQQLDPSDMQISRRHAILTWRGDSWWLQDVSRNGTWVNGQRVYDQVQIDRDSVIEISSNQLRLQI